MSGSIMGIVGSAVEGVDALGKSVKNAFEGDWEKAGKELARYELEAVGIAGQLLLGPGAEIGQEALEGALDNAVLERPSGDVSGPGGKGSDWSFDNLFSGAVEGALNGVSATGGGLGGASGSLGKMLGAFSGKGGGEAAGMLKQVLGASAGESGGKLSQILQSGLQGSSGELSAFGGSMSKFGNGAQLLEMLMQSAGQANNRVASASV